MSGQATYQLTKSPISTFIRAKMGDKFERTDNQLFFAEREGFEPPVPRSTTVFKTAAIDHSATSPYLALAKVVQM